MANTTQEVDTTAGKTAEEARNAAQEFDRIASAVSTSLDEFQQLAGRLAELDRMAAEVGQAANTVAAQASELVALHQSEEEA